MTEERVQRRLAAILAADVVGYSRLMGTDETGTRARFNEQFDTVLQPAIDEHSGRVVKLMGDGILVEFGSVVAAVQCAADIQAAVSAQQDGEPDDCKMLLRIGVHLGDVIVEGDDIHGDGVNIAARLEGLAEPGSAVVSAKVYEEVRGKVDGHFVDCGEQVVKNIARPVRVYRLQAGNEAGQLAANRDAPAMRDTPSIAVLPFSNMSDDAEQEYFCDGLVEDIITTLSKLGGLRVVARNSSFAYKGRSVDVREVAKQLGVRFILEGSVRKSANRFRITTQLIDANDGSHLWAERYDRAADDIFAIQDEITLVVATEMQVKLTEGEQARLHYTTTTNVEAWTFWVQGLSHYRQSINREEMGAARHCWEKALKLDPTSASLNAKLGFLHSLDARFSWWDDHEVAIAKAREYADRALELEPGNADAHTTSSVLFLFQERFDEAVRDARRAVHLAPGSADTLEVASFVLTPSGFPEEALVQSKRAIALSPHHPAVYLGNLGNAYHMSGHIEEAITAFKAYDARSSGFGLVDLVVIYHQNGRPDDAKQTARRLLEARPDFTIASWRKTQFRRDQARLEADIASLAAAGLTANCAEPVRSTQIS